MKRSVIAFLILIAALSGCVYYNTFFNAEKYFASAQEIELKDDGRPTASAIQKYNKAIKKCGIVLTDYKESDYADDALFMLASSLYYIGRNYTQSIEKFEDLIKFYPESEFIPDAKIYIARANYKFRRKELAYELLVEYLQQDEYKKHHSKALQQLADYHLQDENYVEADYYLNQIIEKFPKSDEYDNAFFMKGKARHEAGNYEQSNEVFLALQKSSVPRNLKFDARYYIALNYMLLEEYKLSRKYSNKLLKDEYRENSISRVQLVKARSLAKTDESEDAIQLFNSIILDNKRSKLSAEAAFYLGNHYFEELQNYEEAIKSYNNVKSEYSQSEHMEKSISRSAVASQIIQYNNPNSDLGVEELVLQQFKLGEFYIEALSMPDSALMVYDHIIDQENVFILKLDTLKLELNSIQTIIDSISLRELLYNIAIVYRYGDEDVADSLLNEYQNYTAIDSFETNVVEDSTEVTQNVKIDSLELTQKTVLDSLEIAQQFAIDTLDMAQHVTVDTLDMAQQVTIDTLDMVQHVTADTLEIVQMAVLDSIIVIENAAIDSLKITQNVILDSLILNNILTLDSLAFNDEKNNLRVEKVKLQSDFNALNQQIERTELAIIKYSENFIPFAKFIKLWLYKTVLDDSIKTLELINDLENNYPDNKYTYASNLFMRGQPIEITTPHEIEQLAEYQRAIDLLPQDTSKALVHLDSIASNPDHKFYLKANYSMGHVNYLMLADSNAARPYFDKVLAVEENNDYKAEVTKLYTGTEYKTLTRLPYLDQMEKEAKAKEEEELRKAEEEEENNLTKEDIEKSKENKKSGKDKDLKKEKNKTADDLHPLNKEQVEHIPLPEDLNLKMDETPKDNEESSKNDLQQEADKTSGTKQGEEEVIKPVNENEQLKIESQKDDEQPKIEPENDNKKDSQEEDEPAIKLENEEEPADSTNVNKNKGKNKTKNSKETEDEDEDEEEDEEEEEETSGDNQQTSGDDEN